MKKLFERWYWADAQWWQFWMPGSGAVGGCIFGALITLTAAILGISHG